jgi:iron complex transport system substrate-binding protein
LARFERRPEVLCLNPQDLGDVWRDILWVGEESCRGPQAEALVKQIGTRLAALQQQVPLAANRPCVAFLEWLQPFYVGGHWVPEMIHVAGGVDVLGKVRTPSVRVHLQDIVEAEPEILLIAPCGYSAQQARHEYHSMDFPEQWSAMPAVRNGRVYALEATSYFSRPGPRLVTGIETLAKLFHPAVEVGREAEAAILPIATGASTARAASS